MIFVKNDIYVALRQIMIFLCLIILSVSNTVCISEKGYDLSSRLCMYDISTTEHPIENIFLSIQALGDSESSDTESCESENNNSFEYDALLSLINKAHLKINSSPIVNLYKINKCKIICKEFLVIPITFTFFL